MSFSLPLQRLRAAVLITSLCLANSFSVSAQAQVPVKQWDKTFGGNRNDYLYTVTATADGGCLLGGVSSSDKTGDKTQPNQGPAGTEDCWIVRVDKNGNKLWDRTLGGSAKEELGAVLATSDGGFLVGGGSFSGVSGTKTTPNISVYSNFWLVKLDAQGNPQWERTYGTTSGGESIRTMIATSDGGYLLGGDSAAEIEGDKTQPSRGRSDYWIVKVDGQGTKQWDRTYGGDNAEVLRAVQQTSDGGYLLGGASQSGISGDKSQSCQGDSDFWVVRVDAQGNKQWDQRFGGSKGDELFNLALTADGGCALAGYSFSPRGGDKTEDSLWQGDFWLVKLDANGRKQWDRTLGGNDQEAYTSLQVDSDGGYIIGGVSRSGISQDRTQPKRGMFDYWLVKLDATGTKQWDLAYGAGGNSYCDLRAMDFAQDGGLLLAGRSSANSGGDKTENGRGDTDYWLVKLSASVVTATQPSSALQAGMIYPNPAQTHFTLRLPSTWLRKNLRCSLLDATGRTVPIQVAATPTSDELSVKVGQHATGLYLLRLEGPNGVVATQRVVLE